MRLLLNLRLVCKAFDHAVSRCSFRELNRDKIELPQLPLNDHATAWLLMGEIRRSFRAGIIPDGLTRAIRHAAQAMVRCNREANVGEEEYWKAASMMVVDYRGKDWVKMQFKSLRVRSNELPSTSSHTCHLAGENQRYYDLVGAVCYGDRSIVERVLNEGMDVNTSDEYLGTALYAAVCRGNADIVRVLLDRGADPDAKGHRGTLLEVTAYYGYGDVTQLLLDKGAGITSQNLQHETALIIAAKKGHGEVARVLLRQEHVDPNAQDRDGYTPLHWSARNNHSSVARLLLQRQDICVNAKDKVQITPLQYAVNSGHEEVFRLLASHQACEFNLSTGDKSPLCIAASDGYENILQLLLQKYDLKPEGSQIVNKLLCSAARNGHSEVVRLLLARAGRRRH
ncbi:hypothetical protein VTN77DRAFT_8862 [Rasamsonia byssochlamydoides]|uniref:uncharacterized protein n=1 Tax=Rasamsonia byssochlamydoides TaxID=89139 RepID=UPI003742DF4F